MRHTVVTQSNDKIGPWGSSDLMVLAAFRYCVGRRSYIVHDCINWLIAYWPEFEDFIKNIIRNELEELFDEDDKFRSSNSGHPVLGDNCDRVAWERLRALCIEKC